MGSTVILRKGFLHCLRFDLNKNNMAQLTRAAYAVYVQWILSKMAPGWHGGDELLNKVIISVFFAYKSIFLAL